MRTSAAIVRKRRLFAASMVVVGVVLVVEFVHMPGSSHPTSAASVGTTPSAQAEMPPAYLAWMPGGFPQSVRAAVSAVPGLSATVVVAGDTLWMTASRDAAGTDVDRPIPPYRIPIDAFAVDPAAYTTFIPAAYRDVVTRALADGRAVLGTTSAAVRRLGVGGQLRFGGVGITVGAVVPDAVVGWSELLVLREEGARLGVVDDRYLLARPATTLSDAAFLGLLQPLLPHGVPVRVAAPGEVRYVRVASGSTPPVVLKEVFGEFAAYQDAADPIQLHIDPAWIDAHLATQIVPVLGRETCNRAFFPALEGAMRQLQREGLAHLVTSNAGCYNPELLASLPTAPPAFHAYGAAIDINAPENPFGATPTQDPRLVAVMQHWGFNWGGTFLVPDGMHFEYLSPPPKA
jgi:hypothetical protein